MQYNITYSLDPAYIDVGIHANTDKSVGYPFTMECLKKLSEDEIKYLLGAIEVSVNQLYLLEHNNVEINGS